MALCEIRWKFLICGCVSVVLALEFCRSCVLPLLFRLTHSAFAVENQCVISFHQLEFASFTVSLFFADLQWRVGANGLQVEVFEVCHRGPALPRCGWMWIEMWRATINIYKPKKTKDLKSCSETGMCTAGRQRP